MEPEEYAVMSRAELDHWWYQGLRDLLARCLRHAELAPPPSPKVLDAGCGTGENLRFLQALLAPSYLGGFDRSEQALAFAREKAPGADVYAGDLCDPVLHADELDLLVSLDVLYIPGAERALDGLRRLVSRLRPGGLFVLNLPAFAWLYSEHDVAIHTRERYTARQVRALLETLGLAVERLSYRLCFLFPAVVLWRLRRPAPRDGAARSDLHARPPAAVNRALLEVVKAENRLIARGARLPFGSSVFAIGRKPRV